MSLKPKNINDFRDLTPIQVEEVMLGLGAPKYRATQAIEWAFGQGAKPAVRSFAEMKNLPIDLKEKLAATYTMPDPEIADLRRDSDSTLKFLLRLADGQTIETVLIPETIKVGHQAPRPWRKTLCISSQVGCAMGCKFCFTATMGLKRNLSPSEILSQVIFVQRYLRENAPHEHIRNLVFMGMGEPLHNFDNVRAALDWLTHPRAFNFSKKRITVSTSGLLPEIQRLLDETGVRLAISLNAATGEVREQIMPVTHKYSLEKLIALCRELNLPRDERITFEYVLLAGLNDAKKDADKLVSLLHGVRAKVNLLAFNEFPGAPFKRPADETVTAFASLLKARGVQVNVRKSRGREVLAACGQLRSEFTKTQQLQDGGIAG